MMVMIVEMISPCEEVVNRFKLFGETLAGMHLVCADGNSFKVNHFRNEFFRVSLSEWFAHQVKKKGCRGQCATFHLLQRDHCLISTEDFDVMYLVVSSRHSYNVILIFVKSFYGFQTKRIEKTIGL